MGARATVALLFVAVAARPNAFRVERSAIIAAPADVIFVQLNDLHRWSSWNPLEKKDPGMRLTYTGAPAGVGASCYYVGDKVGEGRMTLIESTPHERVAIRAEFIKPVAATDTIEFTLRPAADGVAVTWAMSGQRSFVSKALSLFVSMDRIVGKHFERGLAALQRVSEAEAQLRADTISLSLDVPMPSAK
jgi:hypothetical protein